MNKETFLLAGSWPGCSNGDQGGGMVQRIVCPRQILAGSGVEGSFDDGCGSWRSPTDKIGTQLQSPDVQSSA